MPPSDLIICKVQHIYKLLAPHTLSVTGVWVWIKETLLRFSFPFFNQVAEMLLCLLIVLNCNVHSCLFLLFNRLLFSDFKYSTKT